MAQEVGTERGSNPILADVSRDEAFGAPNYRKYLRAGREGFVVPIRGRNSGAERDPGRALACLFCLQSHSPKCVLNRPQSDMPAHKFDSLKACRTQHPHLKCSFFREKQ